MDNSTIRLDKYLANLGVCARRAVESLLEEKIVSVNGKRVYKPGVRINPEKDKIVINGVEVKQPELEYYLLNKPKGYISTTSDERSRKNVVSLIKTSARIYPVGRLDKDTTGLLILTNDGELTNKLTHPRYHIDKTYKLTISGQIDESKIKQLEEGVPLDDGITYPAKVEKVETQPNETTIDLTIHEGRNRQIRRMCQALGINLLQLERISIGHLQDPSLEEGQYRQLTAKEIEALQNTH